MKKNILLFGLMILSSLLVSCSDYLDREPLTQIGNDAYWKSKNDLENYTLQYYTSLPAFGIVGSYTGLLSWDATRGVDTQITGVPNTTLNGSRSPVTSGGNWTWENIRSVNVFFDNCWKCTDPFDSYKHFVGEAHFFKAWFYFEKVRVYGDVPWFSKPLEMDSEELYQARDSRILVVDSILWNLDKAIEYLNPLKSADGGNNRISKETALLFKSRVALYEGSWQKYHAGTPFATSGADSKKYFQIAVQAAEELMDPQYTTGLYSNNSPAEDYCKMFSLIDQSGEYLNNTGFQYRKGNDPKDAQAGGGVSWNTNCVTGSIVFRYAEALLNYAEAKCELGETVDYEKSINLLRRRAGMPDFKVQSDPNRSRYADYGYSISDELYEIRRERTVELACEGFRYDDIRRWAAHSLIKGKRPKGYLLDESEWVGAKINYKVDENGFVDPYSGQIPNGYGFKADRDYLDCIPLNEITLNPNLTQNPGW